MRYPLSPRGSIENKEGGRVSSLLSAWEGKCPVNKSSPGRRTVLPSEIRSKEKARAQQSLRSTSATAADSRKNTSVPSWRSTPDKRTPVKQQVWRPSSSPYAKHETSRSPGPHLNSHERTASPRTASKALSAKSYDYIRKWQTIGSPDGHASEVSHKETIGSSDQKNEAYRSQNQQDSPADLSMTYSRDESIPPIKMTDTADSPSMDKLRSDLDAIDFLDYKSTSNREEKHQSVQADKKEEVAEEKEDDEESLYNIDHSHSDASSSLVYSIEDTIPSVASSRKSKESIRSVMERLKQCASSASESSHDGTENVFSAELIASELIASTLAECRMLLQMSPLPTPIAVNAFAEPRKELEETRDEGSYRAINAAPSADDSTASDTSMAKLMCCPCCSHKFAEAGEHEPLHSFACEHIICKECVFQGTRYANNVPCPECGEKGAFDKSKPVVSRSYLRLIKKMEDSASVKTKSNVQRTKGSPMSVPTQINVGAQEKNASDEISVFSSISGHIHTTNLATRYRELAQQIDTENISILSTLSKQQPHSVKSSFTINPKQDDVLSVMSKSECVPPNTFNATVNNDASSGQETESVMSEYQCNATYISQTSPESDEPCGQLDYLQTSFNSKLPPQEPSTPVSRAEYRFLQRKQRLAESLEKVNRVLEKSKIKSMGKNCEEASVSSSRHSPVEEAASVASSRAATSSVASGRVATVSVASSRKSTTEESSSTADTPKTASVTSSSVMSMESNPEVETKKSKPIFIDGRPYHLEENLSRESKERFKSQLRVFTGAESSPFSVHNTAESSPLSVHDAQFSPTPIYDAIEEDVHSVKCSPCESANSRNTASSEASAFNPFGDDPFADIAFGDSNVFRGDTISVVGFGDFITSISSSDTEHEGAFLLPQQKDTKYKTQSETSYNGVQKLTDANRCNQFLPALDFSKNGFNGMESPTASAMSGKKTAKRVKKKQQQYSSAKPQKITQKVFNSFSRSLDEASNTSGFGNTSNQSWRFQETLINPPSIENSDDDHEVDEKPPLYEFSEGSCSLSPTDAEDMSSSLGALVTHKKGFGLKIRDKIKQRTGSKKR
ncbi:hypothetical protein ACHAXM_008102 [Skeletonema potamos]